MMLSPAWNEPIVLWFVGSNFVLRHFEQGSQMFSGLVWISIACRADLCEEYEAVSTERKILTIGDSILAWGTPSCTSVSHQLGLALDDLVVVGAISNTQLTRGTDSIPEQYYEDDWDWVILDGGANDLNKQCGCSESCDVVLDILSTEDGSQGVMVELVQNILLSGTQILMTGYYPMPAEAWYDFEACDEELEQLNQRYARIAGRYSNVHFAPLEEVMDWRHNPELLDIDFVHPSVEGAEKIADYLSVFIGQQD